MVKKTNSFKYKIITMHFVCTQISIKDHFQFGIYKENDNGAIKILWTGKGWLANERIKTSRLK